jgi:hypothetical protein
MTLRSLAIIAALACAASAARAAPPATGRLDFAVIRGDEQIGRHEMLFRHEGDALSVDVRTRVAVKVLFVTAYRFEHDGQELWRDGRLVRLDTKTDDDGAKHELHAKADGAGLEVSADGRKETLDPGILPASLWNEGVVRAGKLLNTLDGRVMAVRVEDLGPETVSVHAKPVAARHYRISGELERDVWYDADSVLVQVRFHGKDGSEIVYQLL